MSQDEARRNAGGAADQPVILLQSRTFFPRPVCCHAGSGPAVWCTKRRAPHCFPIFRDCDVLVVGGGSLGTAAAVAAARTGAIPQGFLKKEKGKTCAFSLNREAKPTFAREPESPDNCELYHS